MYRSEKLEELDNSMTWMFLTKVLKGGFFFGKIIKNSQRFRRTAEGDCDTSNSLSQLKGRIKKRKLAIKNHPPVFYPLFIKIGFYLSNESNTKESKRNQTRFDFYSLWYRKFWIATLGIQADLSRK